MFISLAALLSLASCAIAQVAPIDPPVADRPEDFSNIVGKYTIKVTAEPTEVAIEEPITLRIYLTGEGPAKYEPQRKFLRLLPAWADDFYVQEMRDEHKVIRAEKTWLFVYRLKPKHETIDAIEGIKLIYYDPNIPSKKKFVTRFADRIAITVKLAKEAPPIVVPLAVPDSYYRHAESNVLIRGASPVARSAASLAVILITPPFLCVLGVLAWRRWRPDEAVQIARQRSHAAQRALMEIRSQPVWTVVGRYLRERFDFTASGPTPREVALFLNRRGFAKAVCAQAQAFFEACDLVRFTQGALAHKLADDAALLIQALEADRCARA